MNGSLYSWLKKYPQPHTVLCDEKKIQCGQGVRAWGELHKTVEALDPTKITCLDKDGVILRSQTMDVQAEAETVAESNEIQVFAKLISEAYEKGTKSYAPLLDASMAFIERQGQLLAKAEAEIERLRLINARMRGELAELSAQPGEEGGVLSALVAGIAQGQSEQKPTPIGKAVNK